MLDIVFGYENADHRFDSGRYLLDTGSPFNPDNPQKRVVSIVTCFFSFFGLVASLLVLVLIKRLKVWNPQISLIWWMSVCQCTYDISFTIYLLQESDSKTHWLYYTASFFQLFGGVSVTLFTNVITAVLLYVIMTRRNIDLFRYFHWVLLFTLGPAIAVGAAYLANKTDYVYLDNVLSPTYYWLRIGSIVLNFIFYVVTQRIVNNMSGIRNIDSKRSGEKKFSTVDAIAALTNRSKYYWIMQAISRSGAAVYEGIYGYGGYVGYTGTSQYVGALFFSVLTPSASIGYLVIFLYMQPRALASFKELLFVDIPNWITCRQIAHVHIGADPRFQETFAKNSGFNSQPQSRHHSDASEHPYERSFSESQDHSHSGAQSGTLSGKVAFLGTIEAVSESSNTSDTVRPLDNRPLPPPSSPVLKAASPVTVPTGETLSRNASRDIQGNANSTNVPNIWVRLSGQSTGDTNSFLSGSMSGGMRRNFGSGDIQSLNDLEDEDLFEVIRNNESDTEMAIHVNGNPLQTKIIDDEDEENGYNPPSM